MERPLVLSFIELKLKFSSVVEKFTSVVESAVELDLEEIEVSANGKV